MKNRIYSFILIISFLVVVNSIKVFAQPLFSSTTQQDCIKNTLVFFTNPDEKIVFIDLQLLPEITKTIQVTQTGKIISTLEVRNRKTDTILEIPFAQQQPGIYQIELKTYTGNSLQQLVSWKNNTLKLQQQPAI